MCSSNICVCQPEWKICVTYGVCNGIQYIQKELKLTAKIKYNRFTTKAVVSIK